MLEGLLFHVPVILSCAHLYFLLLPLRSGVYKPEDLFKLFEKLQVIRVHVSFPQERLVHLREADMHPLILLIQFFSPHCYRFGVLAAIVTF